MDPLAARPDRHPNRRVVLDCDPPAGLDTLETLGFPLWFSTPTARTPRGGLHAHFKIPPGNIRNTAGKRGCGIGVNLDWRGLGGYVILPAPIGGYSWDPTYGADWPLADVPPELLPHSRVRTITAKAIKPSCGLTRYAEAALDRACRAILAAPKGEQERTHNGEAFSIGTLAGAGALPADFARDVLKWAAGQLVSYDPHRPWRPGEAEAKAEHAFAAGMRHPREARYA